MSKQSLFRKLGISAVAAGAMLVAGCASMEPAKPEEIVAKRSQAFWNARAEGRVDKAYALTSPAYRKVHTLEEFQKLFGNAFTLREQRL